MKDKITSKVFSNLFIGLIFLFIYAPIISIIIFSFNANSRSGTVWEGFTFRNYYNLFQSEELMRSLFVTLLLAFSATIISVIVGTLAAISLVKYKRKTRSIIFAANDLPIINPDIVTAICLFLLFGVFMIPGGFGSLLIAHVAFCVPYVLITVYPKVKSLDPNIVEAARDLGANSIQAIFKVIVPQLMTAIIASAAIAFTMSFDDFVISYFAIGDSSIQTISLYLYSLKRGVDMQINALTTIIIVVITIIVVINYILTNRQEEKE